MSPTPGATARLADWAAGLTLDDVPPAVVDRTKLLMLDGLACGLLAAHLPWSERAVATVRDLEGTGHATVLGWANGLSPSGAALVNGTFIQGFELDDYHPDGPLHSQACVIPAVLAAAEHTGNVSGRQVLEAVVVGFETGPRVGMAAGGLSLVERGWHCGAIYGTLAASVGAGKIHELDADGFHDAIGIAATSASGLMSAQFSSMVKRMHSGMAASRGLLASALARQGFTGIREVIERDYGGLVTTFTGGSQVDIDALLGGIGGVRWEIDRIAVKPGYACMAGLHTAIEAVLLMTAGSPDDPPQPHDIARIDVAVSPAMFKHGGWELTRPATVTGAQMNLGYAIAVALLDGDAFLDQFSPERIDADDVWELLACIEVTEDPSLDAHRWGVRLRITDRDGRTTEQTNLTPPGGSDRPLSEATIRSKARRMLAAVDTSGQLADRLEELVLGLDEQPDLDSVLALLRSEVRAPFPPVG